ncbi:major capsid protein [Variovorax sp. J22R193]|uniref:major capsid protein n=1 Tax=Variovorax fucosicus TaxID=3053517 RepID=UPI002575BB3F|nr:major capsid protein [Variovorax sp. J22R193]MDM0041873.1 major capsid protein [Variovorax sp. J22R193]
MSLTNMKVFNETIQTATIETLGQMVEKFNAASRGSIVLTSQGFEGDYRFENFWAGIHAAQRRVDRYATNAAATPTNLAQLQAIGVKIAGGFGPIQFEPGQLAWVQKSPAEAVEVISRNMAEAIMKDQLNTAIAALVAAIEAQATATHDTNTGPISYIDLNLMHAKFGDSSSLIVADIVDGATYHSLIGQNLANAQALFQSNGVLVVDILGKVMVVTDAPALRETGTGADVKALGLVAGAATVYDGSSLITNIETTNGLERIVTTMQADYDFGLALKGYAWDTANGGKSPTSAELATGSNWDKVATDIKHTAGVITLAIV